MKTDIITPNLLHTLSKEKQKDFEGILPLLVKKLIINSCESISSIRMPHGDDIWAPGFDGVICCEKQSTYVPAGFSVWEFGTNEDSLGKLNDDYKKRTKNSLGIEKEQSYFIFVTPKVWAYNRQKTIIEWEREHTDWKQVKVYDASILCDWINNEPAVCAWLIEEFFNESIFFSTIENAWKQFSNKTSPCLSYSLFLSDRENELDQFTECLSLPIIRVKANTFIEAEGFVISAIIKDNLLKETCIVVHDENTYYSLNR